MTNSAVTLLAFTFFLTTFAAQELLCQVPEANSNFVQLSLQRVGHTAGQNELDPELRDNQRRTVQVKHARVCLCSACVRKQR